MIAQQERRVFKTPEQMEEEDGIKAQHAVFRALQQILLKAGTGWTVEESPVGGRDDLNGVDIRLISPNKKEHRLLDVSLGDKPGKEGMLVRVYRDWFAIEDDGSWTLRPEKTNDFIQRAVKPTMEAPAVGVSSR